MPKFTLYTDLSVNFPHAFAAIEACKKDVAARNCFLPLAPPWRMGGMPSHQPLWAVTENGEREENRFPSFWQPWFNRVLQAAKRGEDILLYGRESSPARWKMFLDILRAHTEFDSHTICGIAVIGRPVCLLEQPARLIWPGQRSSARWFAFAREYAQLVHLTQLWNAEFGAEHALLFADTSEQPEAKGLSPGHVAALEQMGLNLPALPVQIPHILALASRAARHFLIASEVGNNSWPLLDRARLTACLKKLEQEAVWDRRPISAPKYRAALERHAGHSLRQLEDALRLEPGALACPAELDFEKPWQAYAYLSDEAIHAFVEGLPKEMAQALHQRYLQDYQLLGPGQKRICQYLSRVSLTGGKARRTPSPEQTLVSVLTLARNQEAYIGKCIEGVLAQKTDFPVRHIILDHCSTDGTPDIIREYAEKYPSIQPILLSQWVNGQHVKRLFSRCRSKYVALCDGDDYFTDPLKLQKQVDFLEAHPECALCFHPVDVTYADGAPTHVSPPHDLPSGATHIVYTMKDLLYANLIQTCSVMYRWRFTDGLPDWFDPTLVPGDWYWHLLHAETGLIGYLRDRMSVYFRHAASLYASAEKGPLEHRRIHGLDELRVYCALNSHFQGRYYSDFRWLATGVLADFVRIYMETGNDSLLTKAAKISPEFTNDFLKQIQDL